MLDSDVAMIYHYETKNVNKKNIYNVITTIYEAK